MPLESQVRAEPILTAKVTNLIFGRQWWLARLSLVSWLSRHFQHWNRYAEVFFFFFSGGGPEPSDNPTESETRFRLVRSLIGVLGSFWTVRSKLLKIKKKQSC